MAKFTSTNAINQVVAFFVHSIILCTNAKNERFMEVEKMKKYESCCGENGIFKIIGGKWKAMLIKNIAAGCPKRFGELRRDMENIAQTTLTLQLRELERDGIICRKIYAETPPRVEYKLTEVGISLLPLLEALDNWWWQYQDRETVEK